MHIRRQVRDAVAAALSGATSGSLYVEQANRLGSADAPAIVVYCRAETVQSGERSMGGYTIETDQTVELELHAVADTGLAVAEALDDMDEECEQLLGAAAPLQPDGGLLELLVRESSSAEMTTDQDRVYGLRTVAYIATWRHTFGAPDTPEG